MDDGERVRLRLRDEELSAWLSRRMAALGDTPRAQLGAMFAALGGWFGRPGLSSGLFNRAASEHRDPGHPIHARSAEHERLLFRELRAIAEASGAPDPSALARALLLMKVGAIVSARFGHEADPAADAGAAARN